MILNILASPCILNNLFRQQKLIYEIMLISKLLNFADKPVYDFEQRPKPLVYRRLKEVLAVAAFGAWPLKYTATLC